MSTAHRTPAGEALRGLLPDGADPYELIQLGCDLAYQARDDDPLPGCVDLVKEDPEQAAALLVTLAALVDIDSTPGDMLGWLADPAGQQEETARRLAAYAAAREEVEADLADTLPPVTLESMRELAHTARIAGALHPCGTLGGWYRHRAKGGGKTCNRCRTARALYDAATPEQRALLRTPMDRRRYKAPCGTPQGYNAHRDRSEDPCDDCRTARAKYDAERYQARRARQTKDTPSAFPVDVPKAA